MLVTGAIDHVAEAISAKKIIYEHDTISSLLIICCIAVVLDFIEFIKKHK